ncbi:hypothetical protein ABT009_23325 [Streptomyces sp. NPDC002896]|uniref:hypothetical protein n=1 Tax=Streptomyces sp. NPDC002896 TaxID=3154438 RepID=UPI003333C83F
MCDRDGHDGEHDDLARTQRSRLLTDRLQETAIGVCTAVVVLWATGRRTPLRTVHRQVRRTVAAVARVLDLVDLGETPTGHGRRARRDLQFELGRLTAVHAAATADNAELTTWRHVESALGQLAHEALAACWHTGARRALSAGATRDALQLLLENLGSQPAGRNDGATIAGELERARSLLAESGQPAGHPDVPATDRTLVQPGA